MTTKPFSKKLHARHDESAKKAAIEFILEVKGDVLELKTPLDEQPNMYGDYDFFMNRIESGEEIYFETEVKNNWDVHGKWVSSFPTLDVPSRKEESKADFYIMFNGSLDTLFISRMAVVQSCDRYFKRTEYTTNEEFFAVPVFRTQDDGKPYGSFYKKVNGQWEKMKGPKG